MTYKTASGHDFPRVEGGPVGPGPSTRHNLAMPVLYEHPQLPAPPGYVWEQFVFSGTVMGQTYRTLLQVIRPEDPTKASGIVVIEPWHRAGYWTLYSKVQGYLSREGHTAAVVVSNRNVLETAIKPQNPTYFDSLSLADTEFTDSQVMADAGVLLRCGVIPGVVARKIILGGQSTEAYWVRRFMSQEHNVASFDGQHIYDGYFPAQSALSSPRAIIEDFDVPVIELQGESELIRSFARGGSEASYRREDAENYRLYEVPGMPHVCTRHGASSSRTATMNCLSTNWSNFPLFDVFHVALDNLITWIDRGIAAPSAERMKTLDAGRVIVRDDHSNALGGLRTSYFEVPTVTIHATCGETPEDLRSERCDFFAWDEPFSTAKLKMLYRSHEDYVANVTKSLDQLVSERWYLVEDALAMRNEAIRVRVL